MCTVCCHCTYEGTLTVHTKAISNKAFSAHLSYSLQIVLQPSKMNDNVTGASDKDNVLLTSSSSNSLKITSNAQTQTPELGRRTILANDVNSAQPSSSVVVLRIDNQKDITDFAKEAKALSIPDVVVEFIRDSRVIEVNGYDKGTTNPAFDAEESLTRSPSKLSLRDECHTPSEGSSNCFHGSVQERSGGESEMALLPIGSANRKMYYSMPRNQVKRLCNEDFRMRSQPGTPQLHRSRMHDNQVDCSTSSLSIFPPNGADIPPSPNFGYRPLESETSAVYTIIKTYIDSDEMSEVHFLPTYKAEPTPKLQRKFEYVPLPEAVERKRRRLQCATDSCSLMFFLPGIFIAIFTPVVIIPMFLLPLTYFLELLAVFIFTGTLSVIILAISGFLGNLFWHYDEKSQKLRLRLHCGTGPMKHFWGSGFYYNSDEKKEKKKKELMV